MIDKRTRNLFRRATPSLPLARLVGDRTILNVVQLASTCSANVAFTRFAAACVPYGMLHRAVAYEVSRLAEAEDGQDGS